MALTKTHFPRSSGGYSWVESMYHPNVHPSWQQFGRGMPIMGECWGNVYYVHSSGAGSTTDGFSPESAVTTADAATNLTTASNNDLVLFLPGHSETISGAGTWAPDVAGVTYIGLGRGGNRPTLSFTATASTVTLSGANNTLCNFLLTNDVDAVVTAIPVTGPDAALLNLEFRDVTGNALVWASFSAAADRPIIDGLFCNCAPAIASGSGATNSVLVLTGCDNPVVRNSTLIATADISLIECRTTAVVQLEVYNCRLFNLDNRAAGTAGTCVEDVVTGSSGFIGPDVMCIQGANAANITEAITGATFHMFDPVYVVNAVNEKAMLSNWTASTDA